MSSRIAWWHHPLHRLLAESLILANPSQGFASSVLRCYAAIVGPKQTLQRKTEGFPADSVKKSSLPREWNREPRGEEMSSAPRNAGHCPERWLPWRLASVIVVGHSPDAVPDLDFLVQQP